MMDFLQELSFRKLQKRDFDKLKFLLNNLLQSHTPLK